MCAKKGLRQGDPISPLLFVVVMEYLHRKLKDLHSVPNFKAHNKCKKAGIVEVSFADDLLLFSRGDKQSVQLMMQKYEEFSRATGLVVNLAKCKVYCGGMNKEQEESIAEIIGFKVGSLPFKYLGIPLESKRLSNNQCALLVEKIGRKINHWSAQMLSYAGRKDLSSRRALIAWSKICESKKHGGLNVFDLERWNNTCLMKLLRNLNQKVDSLWVRWVHSYYIKSSNVMIVPVKASCSWIHRAILHQRQKAQEQDNWNRAIQDNRFCKEKVYLELGNVSQPVSWRRIMYGNDARPRAIFTTWMACHGRLATKERLVCFGILNSAECVFCTGVEDIQHLLF
ncbi:uncharacterized protein LOC131620133 [Vicia villosa]|uniref:uncharacterized protein LOC131620133 n=1 Tax=Vicia villosa TaxID=3911 RepID=UPI00273C9BCB|nr:uncharacterized protein LOC131620133 [Vicia villosa]